jgi:hypothetical protein
MAFFSPGLAVAAGRYRLGGDATDGEGVFRRSLVVNSPFLRPRRVLLENEPA